MSEAENETIAEEDQSPAIEAAEPIESVETEAEAGAEEARPRRSTKKQQRAERASEGPVSHLGQAVGKEDVDPVYYSRFITARTNSHIRRSLTVYHVQRRLAEWGFVDGLADNGGRYGAATEVAVRGWRRSIAGEGVLDSEAMSFDEFALLFKNDGNVRVLP